MGFEMAIAFVVGMVVGVFISVVMVGSYIWRWKL